MSAVLFRECHTSQHLLQARIVFSTKIQGKHEKNGNLFNRSASVYSHSCTKGWVILDNQKHRRAPTLHTACNQKLVEIDTVGCAYCYNQYQRKSTNDNKVYSCCVCFQGPIAWHTLHSARSCIKCCIISPHFKCSAATFYFLANAQLSPAVKLLSLTSNYFRN